jgi:hypothetical protein
MWVLRQIAAGKWSDVLVWVHRLTNTLHLKIQTTDPCKTLVSANLLDNMYSKTAPWILFHYELIKDTLSVSVIRPGGVKR